MPKFRQLNEALDWIVKGSDEQDIVNRIHFCLQTDSSFRGYMMIAVQKECKIRDIPEGMPPNVKLQKDIPDGMGETMLRAEFRRVKAFVVGQAMERVKPYQREMQWVQILEGVHWKEAELLTQIKDQTLLGLYPALVSALPAAGVPITIDLGPVGDTTDGPRDTEGASEVVEPVVVADPTEVDPALQKVEVKAEAPKKRGKKKDAEVVQTAATE